MGDGFWNLLAFGMQMALIIVTGHALASSAPVKKFAAYCRLRRKDARTVLVLSSGSVACVIN